MLRKLLLGLGLLAIAPAAAPAQNYISCANSAFAFAWCGTSSLGTALSPTPSYVPIGAAGQIYLGTGLIGTPSTSNYGGLTNNTGFWCRTSSTCFKDYAYLVTGVAGGDFTESAWLYGIPTQGVHSFEIDSKSLLLITNNATHVASSNGNLVLDATGFVPGVSDTVTGLTIKTYISGGGVDLTARSATDTNVNLRIDGKGSGTVTINGTATGAVTIGSTTYPKTVIDKNILYASGTNAVGQITTANSSVLVTDSGGTPSLSTTLPAVTLTTPAIGVATGTSLALGGCTISGLAFCVTGGSTFSGNMTLGTAPYIGWGASFTADATISRNAAGVIQFGTTAANASGSWTATNGTLSTGLTSPLHIGGSGTTGTQLTFKTTTGNGTTDAYAFTGGNNGATTFATLQTGSFNIQSGSTYSINGTSVLSGNTLGSGVTASSLTSVGTITTGTWNAGTVTSSSTITATTTVAVGASSAFLIGSTKLADVQLTNYHALYNKTGGVAIYMGDSTALTNFYDNNAHTFRGADHSTAIANFSTTGVVLSTVANAANNNLLCYNSGTGAVTRQAEGTTCTVSAARFKKDIVPIDPAWALNVATSLEPSSWRYREESGFDDGVRHAGFIADQVLAVAPDFGVTDDDGKPYKVRYGDLAAVWAGAIRALRDENNQLRARLDRLEQRRSQ